MLAGESSALAALAATGIDVFVVGRAGGERIAISAAESELEVPLVDAERAWGSLAERVASVIA